MRHLVQQFLDQQLSRRGFIEGLTAMGITAAGVSTIVRATEAAENGLPKTARRMTCFHVHYVRGLSDLRAKLPSFKQMPRQSRIEPPYSETGRIPLR